VTSRADLLLSGRRGRRLCAELLARADGGLGPPWRWFVLGTTSGRTPGEHDRLQDDVRAALAVTDLSAVGLPWRLLDALLATVDRAMYWEPPDDVDVVLADDEIAALLAPVAETVVRAPASQWWTTPIDLADQHAVAWPAGDPPGHRPSPPSAQALAHWRAQTLAEEQRSAPQRRSDPRRAASGNWTSTPIWSGLLETTRTLSGIAQADGVDRPAPAGLVLVEDEMGWECARSWPVRPPATARVLELTGPAAWTALVERYPLEVSASRRGTWWQVSGWDGAWLIPDWAAVAAEFDAVHLTVDGYLSAATRALPVHVPGPDVPGSDVPGGAARTMLAGGAPDATWWLTDVLAESGQPTDWRRAQGELPRWTPA